MTTDPELFPTSLDTEKVAGILEWDFGSSEVNLAISEADGDVGCSPTC